VAAKAKHLRSKSGVAPEKKGDIVEKRRDTEKKGKIETQGEERERPNVPPIAENGAGNQSGRRTPETQGRGNSSSG